MEKKEYLSPTIQIVEMESCCILAGSEKDNTGEYGPGAVITSPEYPGEGAYLTLLIQQ